MENLEIYVNSIFVSIVMQIYLLFSIIQNNQV